jgi:hypothetical protein
MKRPGWKPNVPLLQKRRVSKPKPPHVSKPKQPHVSKPNVWQPKK